MRWLGLDPSLSAFGWAVCESETQTPGVVDIGVWRTKIDGDEGKLEGRARRIYQLGQQLIDLVDLHRPRRAFIESLVFLGPDASGRSRQSKSGVSASSRVRGMVEGICLAKGLELHECRPHSVRLAIVGQKKASKEDMARRLRQLFPVPCVMNAGLDATDALAVAVYGDTRAVPLSATPNVVRAAPEVEADPDYSF